MRHSCTPERDGQPRPSDTLAELSVELHTAKAKAEIALLEAIAADAQLVHVFADAGGRAEHFQQPDTSAIFTGLQQAHERGHDQFMAARCCRFCLRAAGCWDAGAIAASRGMRWSDKSLASLFDSWFPSPAVVKNLTSELIELATRIDDAQAHYAFIVDRMTFQTRQNRFDFAAKRSANLPIASETSPIGDVSQMAESVAA